MTEDQDDNAAKRKALKKLREARSAKVAAVAERVKRQKKAIGLLRGLLDAEGKTAPELARLSAMPASEVLWYLASLKKYGEVFEGEKDNGYYRYTLRTEPASQETAEA
jgi:hypothetical protein